MQWDLLIATMFNLPGPSMTLIMIMSALAMTLVYHLLDTGPYTTIISYPFLVLSGMFGNALIILNNVAITADRSVNIIIGACFGFSLLSIVVIGAFHVWSRMRDA